MTSTGEFSEEVNLIQVNPSTLDPGLPSSSKPTTGNKLRNKTETENSGIWTSERTRGLTTRRKNRRKRRRNRRKNRREEEEGRTGRKNREEEQEGRTERKNREREP